MKFLTPAARQRFSIRGARPVWVEGRVVGTNPGLAIQFEGGAFDTASIEDEKLRAEAEKYLTTHKDCAGRVFPKGDVDLSKVVGKKPGPKIKDSPMGSK